MGWSKKYKRSIDCSNPKGFSQKAHCAGRKKKENVMSSKLEELVGKRLTEEQLDEAAGKKDACYYKVKARYDVWPSAYASGALVKCRKVGAKNWGNKSKKEGVNEAGMELNKLKDAIKMFQKKIEKQGRVTNARDEEHLSNLIKLYNQMGGKGIKEGVIKENPAAIAAAQRMVVQNKSGKKISVNTARQSSYAEKDPVAHKKAKNIFQRIKDKFVKEAVSPKGWNMSKKFITILGREVKNLVKYHRQQNEEDFLEVANYMELQLKYMKKNLKESVDEALDPYKDFSEPHLKPEYNLNLGAFIDHYQKFMKFMKRYKEVPDKNKREWALAIRNKVGQGMFSGHMSQMTNIMDLLQKGEKFRNLKESVEKARGTCWVGYQQKGMKKKGDRMVPNCVKEIIEIYYEENGEGHGYTIEHIKDLSLNEAEYQGRKVKLGKIMQGDVKKFKVYVKNPKGNVVKVNFGQGGDAKGGTMRIRKSNPKARANFRARHNCDNPGPRHKARYWSCRKW